jgi:hypothetical protein
MRLYVRIRGVEQCLDPSERQVLYLIDELTATVVALAGIALGVLVSEDGTLGFKDRTRDEVLTGNHLQGISLATEFGSENGCDFRVYLTERGGEL